MALEGSSRALDRQWIGACRHGKDEMKGIAHGRIRRDRHPVVAPFGFQIGHGVLPLNHLTVLILDFELALRRNVGEIIGDASHAFRRPDEFTTTCGGQRTMACNFCRT